MVLATWCPPGLGPRGCTCHTMRRDRTPGSLAACVKVDMEGGESRRLGFLLGGVCGVGAEGV